MQIPDELWSDIRAMAQARLDAAMAEINSNITSMVEEYATAFIDVSTLSDEGTRLAHKATGRTLTIKAEWDG